MRNTTSARDEAGKASPLMIVLIILGAGVVMIGLVVVLAGAFFFHKAKEAGLNSDLLNENPGIAVAKMAAAMNPNVEVVSVDEDSGKITLYDKESDKTVTLDLEQVANGKISFGSVEEDTAGGEVRESGTVGLESSTTSVEFGEVKLPDWIPLYPGATLQGGVTGRSSKGISGHAALTTTDSPDQVSSFYEDSLREEGLEVNTIRHSGAAGSGAMINAEGVDDGRRATVMIAAADKETTANITYTTED